MSDLGAALAAMVGGRERRGAFDLDLAYDDSPDGSRRQLRYRVVQDGSWLAVLDADGDDRLVTDAARWLACEDGGWWHGDGDGLDAFVPAGPWTPVVDKVLMPGDLLAALDVAVDPDGAGEGEVAGRPTWRLRATRRRERRGFDLMGLPGWYAEVGAWGLDVDRGTGLLVAAVPVGDAPDSRLSVTRLTTEVTDRSPFDLDPPAGVTVRRARSQVPRLAASLVRAAGQAAVARVRG